MDIQRKWWQILHFGPAAKSVNYLPIAETCFPATVKYVIICLH